MTSTNWKARQESIVKFRDETINFSDIRGERELLTPQAVGRLYGKGRSTITQALSRGKLEAVFTMTDGTRLISLASLLNYWGEPDPARLDEMRSTAHNLWVTDTGPWLILGQPTIDTLREVK